ncbi:MAG: penicillin-binding protein 2 [Alphaproteobacteria bacterium]|nr:penicillin-binding protein 2 [Alphaproteobacteria bacterium]
MRRDPQRSRLFTRRVAVLAGGKALLMAGIGMRLYDVQVRDSDRYALLAEDNRINLRLIVPPRGRILDRFGVPLAANRPDYRLLVTPDQTDDLSATLEALRAMVAISEDDERRVLREAERTHGVVPVTVCEDLAWDEVAEVEVNTPDLPGVLVEAGRRREYPFGVTVAHVTGYVAPVAESELTDDPLVRHPDFRIGKSGIEKQYDQALRGAAGASQVEVNAFGRVIRELDRDEGRAGDDVALALDIGLQAYAVNRFGAETGSAAVIDIATGGVLALATVPSYDPTQFTRGLSQSAWQDLVADKRGPLGNKAIAGQYPPGSTFKMVVALAALDSGVAGPGHGVFCPGQLRLGNATFRCWKKGGHGTLDMTQAIQQSCDVYFYDLARKLGIDRIAAMARRFGLGGPTGLDLPGEKPGLVPTAAWKEAVYGEPFHPGDTVVAGIGQGYMLATPLQLCLMAARIASGRMLVPHLARAGGEPAPDMGLVPEHVALVREGMNQVTNSQRGTAYRARISEPGLEMAGKTGTAQVRRLTQPERDRNLKLEDIPWEHRDHGLFVAYAPVAAPRYACAVVVEHGGSGSKAAAPIARDILYEAQRRNSARDPNAPATALLHSV